MIPDLNQMLNLNLIGLVDNPYVWIALRFVVGAAFIANSTSKTVYQVNYGFESLAQRPKCFRLESCPQLANFTDVPYWTNNLVTLSLAFIFSFTLFIVELTSGSWRARSHHWLGEMFWQIGYLLTGLAVFIIPGKSHLFR